MLGIHWGLNQTQFYEDTPGIESDIFPALDRLMAARLMRGLARTLAGPSGVVISCFLTVSIISPFLVVSAPRCLARLPCPPLPLFKHWLPSQASQDAPSTDYLGARSDLHGQEPLDKCWMPQAPKPNICKVGT